MTRTIHFQVPRKIRVIGIRTVTDDLGSILVVLRGVAGDDVSCKAEFVE